jgi:hypothetical protein
MKKMNRFIQSVEKEHRPGWYEISFSRKGKNGACDA